MFPVLLESCAGEQRSRGVESSQRDGICSIETVLEPEVSLEPNGGDCTEQIQKNQTNSRQHINDSTGNGSEETSGYQRRPNMHCQIEKCRMVLQTPIGMLL